MSAAAVLDVAYTLHVQQATDADRWAALLGQHPETRDTLDRWLLNPDPPVDSEPDEPDDDGEDGGNVIVLAEYSLGELAGRLGM